MLLGKDKENASSEQWLVSELKGNEKRYKFLSIDFCTITVQLTLLRNTLLLQVFQLKIGISNWEKFNHMLIRLLINLLSFRLD